MIPKILTQKISLTKLKEFGDAWYSNFVKGSVDIELKIVGVGGDYHIETCELLTKSGSRFEDVWGFNIRFDEDKKATLEFDSMVNIKLNFGNRGRGLYDEEKIKVATEIIKESIDLD